MASNEKREGSGLDKPSTDAIVTELAKQDKTPWYKKPNLRMLYLIMLPTCLGVESTCGFDASMLNGLQAVHSWDTFFHSPRSTLLGLMSSMYSLGGIIALPLVPVITDRLGRRYSIVFGSVLMIIGAIIQACSQNSAMFMIARLILGMGIPFAIVAASSLIGELSHPKERAIMGSLFTSCYAIGAIIVAGVTLGTFNMKTDWGWRIPSVFQILPSLFQITFIHLLPESPRWLISRGRGEEAMAILAKYHAEGDMNSEFIKAEYIQIEQTLELEKESSKVGWMDMFRQSGMRKRLLIGSILGLFTQWSGNGLISYYLARVLDNIGIHDNRTKNLINLALGCWGLANSTILALIISRFKRRNMYLLCTVSLTLIFTGWTIASARYTVTGSQASSRAVIVFIFLYSPAYSIAYSALTYPYLVELFPFHVRAKGITVFQFFSRTATFFNQFVNPIGINNAGWKFYISYCIWLAFEVVFVYFAFPETAGKTLEELSFLYEPDQLEKQKQRVEKEMNRDHHMEERKSSIEKRKIREVDE